MTSTELPVDSWVKCELHDVWFDKKLGSCGMCAPTVNAAPVVTNENGTFYADSFGEYVPCRRKGIASKSFWDRTERRIPPPNAGAPTPETDALRNEIEGGRFVSWLEVLPAFWRVFDKMAVIEGQRDAARASLNTVGQQLLDAINADNAYIAQLKDRAKSAESQLAALAEKCREDSDRLDWLQDNLVIIRDIGWIEKHDLRAAIDTARKETPHG